MVRIGLARKAWSACAQSAGSTRILCGARAGFGSSGLSLPAVFPTDFSGSVVRYFIDTIPPDLGTISSYAQAVPEPGTAARPRRGRAAAATGG